METPELREYVKQNWKKNTVAKMAKAICVEEYKIDQACKELDIEPITYADMCDSAVLKYYKELTASQIYTKTGLGYDAINKAFERLKLEAINPKTQYVIDVQNNPNEAIETIAERLNVGLDFLKRKCDRQGISYKTLEEVKYEKLVSKYLHAYHNPDEYSPDEVQFATMALEHFNRKPENKRPLPQYTQYGSPHGLADEMHGIEIKKL
jgi:hypothetical protein